MRPQRTRGWIHRIGRLPEHAAHVVVLRQRVCGPVRFRLAVFVVGHRFQPAQIVVATLFDEVLDTVRVFGFDQPVFAVVGVAGDAVIVWISIDMPRQFGQQPVAAAGAVVILIGQHLHHVVRPTRSRRIALGGSSVIGADPFRQHPAHRIEHLASDGPSGADHAVSPPQRIIIVARFVVVLVLEAVTALWNFEVHPYGTQLPPGVDHIVRPARPTVLGELLGRGQRSRVAQTPRLDFVNDPSVGIFTREAYRSHGQIIIVRCCSPCVAEAVAHLVNIIPVHGVAHRSKHHRLAVTFLQLHLMRRAQLPQRATQQIVLNVGHQMHSAVFTCRPSGRHHDILAQLRHINVINAFHQRACRHVVLVLRDQAAGFHGPRRLAIAVEDFLLLAGNPSSVLAYRHHRHRCHLLLRLKRVPPRNAATGGRWRPS